MSIDLLDCREAESRYHEALMYIDMSESELDLLKVGHYDVNVPIECKLGDEIVFRINEQPVARAIVDRIEKFDGYRFFWREHTFEKLSNTSV